jgi:rhodanese-related sulfurtransferase
MTMKTAEVKTIDAANLAQRMKTDVGVQVWNVLDDEWFKDELIPGSKRVALAGLEQAVQTSSLTSDTPVVVYCAGPTCPSSRTAAEKLAALGYTNVVAFEGGLEEWKKNGRGVVGTGERG